jgi:SPP1 family predicted phage head-tail adaptor
MKEYFRKKEAIGRMRHRVQFLKPTYTLNSFGEKVKTYTAQDVVWAHIEYTTSLSDESVEAQRILARVNCRVTIRFNSEINAEWRMLHNNEKFEIRSVLPDAKQMYMLLECEIDEPVTSY